MISKSTGSRRSSVLFVGGVGAEVVSHEIVSESSQVKETPEEISISPVRTTSSAGVSPHVGMNLTDPGVKPSPKAIRFLIKRRGSLKLDLTHRLG